MSKKQKFKKVLSLLLYLFIVISINSCVFYSFMDEHLFYSRVSNDYKEFIPYKGNDTLIFKSFENNYDTMVLSNYHIEKTNSNGPLSLVTNFNESVHIDAKFLYSYKYKSKIFEYSQIFRCNDDKSFIFNFITITSNNSISIEVKHRGAETDLNYFQASSLQKPKANFIFHKRINNIEYSDLILFLTEAVKINDIEINKVYWSLSKGLVKFEKENGDYWELDKVIRN